MNILLKTEGAFPLEEPTTLDQFLEANIDGLDQEEIAEIRSALERGETYHGGGGSIMEWSVGPI